MSQNRKRILAEVLSLDAWHTPFKVNGSTASVHVEVSFEEGRLGGEDPEIPFTFRINLKRALLTVHLEEPLKLKRSSVARDIPETAAELTRLLAAKDVAKRSGQAKGGVNLSSFTAGISGAVAGEQEASREEQVKVVQTVPRIIATAKPRGEHEYAWDLQPSYGTFLEGQPWGPQKSPRMQVRPPQKPSPIQPTTKVTLSCNLEDLAIDEITPKSSGLIDQIVDVVEKRNSMAAAKQYLKLVLLRADLEVGELDNSFSELRIADVLASEEEP